MDQVNYNCSTKDIPIPTKKECRIHLIHSVKKFYDNICWRVWHFQNPSNKEKAETFGFPSTNKVPRPDDLKDLESDLYDLVENIEFRSAKNHYQKELQTKIDAIKTEAKVNGAKFLRIMSKNFPNNHPLHKILNKNTLKINYRCMPNLKQHIDRHNAQVLNQNNQPEERCNCQKSKKGECPIPGKCATPSVVYRATVRRHDNCAVDCYTGLTGDPFKTRYSKHNSDFRLKKNTASKLAYHVCNLTNNNIQHDINWEIVTRAPSYNPTSRICRLCITEAYYIMFLPGGANLNKRDELFGSCKHKTQKLLIKDKT